MEVGYLVNMKTLVNTILIIVGILVTIWGNTTVGGSESAIAWIVVAVLLLFGMYINKNELGE